MIRLATIALAFCLFPAISARADAVDEMVTAYVKEKGLPGLSMAVVQHGEVVKRAAHGLASVELMSPATVDTVYEIGSITKMFTATLVMMLVEEGAIDLDAPISTYLDDLPEAWGPITVRQLLTHTSGLPNYTSVTDFQKLSRDDHTAAEIIALVADKPLGFEPGTKWAYSNTGYYLLGLIVEKAGGGRSFAAILDDRILKPLGMTNTRPNNPNLIVPGRAAAYGTALGLVRVNRHPLTPSSAFSAGFLISTVDDLVAWDTSLREGSLLTPESYEAMYAPVKLNDGSTHPYGFGWGTSRQLGHLNLSHGGGTAGYTSLLSRYPDDGLTIILLCNQADADLATLARRLTRHYVPALDFTAAEALDDPEPETTERIRNTVCELLNDRIDAEVFTPRMVEVLESPAGRSTTRGLAAKGALDEFVLIEREAEAEGTRLRYRARLGTAIYLMTVNISREGKISGLRTQEAD